MNNLLRAWRDAPEDVVNRHFKVRDPEQPVMFLAIHMVPDCISKWGLILISCYCRRDTLGLLREKQCPCSPYFYILYFPSYLNLKCKILIQSSSIKSHLTKTPPTPSPAPSDQWLSLPLSTHHWALCEPRIQHRWQVLRVGLVLHAVER